MCSLEALHREGPCGAENYSQDLATVFALHWGDPCGPENYSQELLLRPGKKVSFLKPGTEKVLVGTKKL